MTTTTPYYVLRQASAREADNKRMFIVEMGGVTLQRVLSEEYPRRTWRVHPETTTITNALKQAAEMGWTVDSITQIEVTEDDLEKVKKLMTPQTLLNPALTKSLLPW